MSTCPKRTTSDSPTDLTGLDMSIPAALALRRTSKRSTLLAELERHLPDAEFNRLMERYIEKEDPDKIIGWPKSPVPPWALGFRPKVVLDLGCGLGAVTTSVLRRLHEWGCLSRLREVVLVDNDPALHDQGAPGLKVFLESRVRTVLDELGLRNFAVTAHVETLRVETSRTGVSDLTPLDQICPKADLVLASHVTYYFGDGSGQALVDAIARRRLSPGGRIWVDIRDLDCPVYRARRDLLVRIKANEPQPFDYAEYFEKAVLPRLSSVSLLDRAHVDVQVRPGTDSGHAAMLMMWRGELRGATPRERAMIEAATVAANSAAHLYSETQFILGIADERRR